MKTVVITGSSRGIGFGLAQAFLSRGSNVVISARGQMGVNDALASLSAQFGNDRVLGLRCNVADLAQMETLWQEAAARFGRVDIWINNAGAIHAARKSWEIAPEEMRSVVDTNLMGVLCGCRVAIRGMLQQDGGGHVYLMEGLGSNGSIVDGATLYGTTKYAQVYLRKALAKEVEGTQVKVSAISPGIVITDLLLDPYRAPGVDDPAGLARAKRIFNILGDKVETVTPWLADEVLANKKSGNVIEWLTRAKITRRFATAPFKKRDLFAAP